MVRDDLRMSLAALQQNPSDRGQALALCREVSFQLPHRDWQSLRDLRSMVGTTCCNLRDAGDATAEYAVGVLSAVGEMMAAFETASLQAEDEQFRQDLSARHRVLLDKLDMPHQPSDLARALSKSLPQISRTLADLRRAGLVMETSQTDDQDRRSRFYVRTGLADVLLGQLCERNPTVSAAQTRQPLSNAQ